MSEHALETQAPDRASPLIIQVDMREQGSSVPALLAAYPDLTLRFGALPSGDYVLAEEVAVERKTAADFVASILDRRLFGQAARLRALSPRRPSGAPWPSWSSAKG